MDFEVGKLYKVNPEHQFHPNRVGRFEFLGGSDQSVAVFTDPQTEVNTESYKHQEMFATGLDDVKLF